MEGEGSPLASRDVSSPSATSGAGAVARGSPPGCCLRAVVCSKWKCDFLISCPNTLSPGLFRPASRLGGRPAWFSCSVGTGLGPGARCLSLLRSRCLGSSLSALQASPRSHCKLLDNINHWIMLKNQDFWLFKITWSSFPLSHVASNG